MTSSSPIADGAVLYDLYVDQEILSSCTIEAWAPPVPAITEVFHAHIVDWGTRRTATTPGQCSSWTTGRSVMTSIPGLAAQSGGLSPSCRPGSCTTDGPLPAFPDSGSASSTSAATSCL